MDKERYKRRFTSIDSEELEMQRESEAELTRLGAQRRAAISNLENAEAFRAVIEQLVAILGDGSQAELDRSESMSTHSYVAPSPVQTITARWRPTGCQSSLSQLKRERMVKTH